VAAREGRGPGRDKYHTQHLQTGFAEITFQALLTKQSHSKGIFAIAIWVFCLFVCLFVLYICVSKDNVGSA
jgi:hypothetical protein